MFNPFDGALVFTATVGSTLLAIITGNSPVLAAVASAFVGGLFLLAGKVIEIYVRNRADKRVADLERKIRELQAR